MRRIGIFPGVFDPVHEGHIAFALAAAQSSQLDTVYLVPESEPWHKTQVTPLRHRMAMLRILTADYPQLIPLRLGLRRFTVTGMINELDHHFKGSELHLLMGSDAALHSLPSWQNHTTLIQTMPLIIGVRTPDILAKPQLGQLYPTATLLETTAPHVSSTIIRQGDHPHPGIATYIRSNQLYT